jgi:hypothetical protein
MHPILFVLRKALLIAWGRSLGLLSFSDLTVLTVEYTESNNGEQQGIPIFTLRKVAGLGNYAHVHNRA